MTKARISIILGFLAGSTLGFLAVGGCVASESGNQHSAVAYPSRYEASQLIQEDPSWALDELFTYADERWLVRVVVEGDCELALEYAVPCNPDYARDLLGTD